MVEKKIDLKFPKRFFWGAATSAHQVEGNTHNQWTVWELENASELANQAEKKLGSYMASWNQMKTYSKDPDNYVSARLADHYNRYKEDFDLLQKMNMNSYRFSIEWSRIEPRCGVWDVESIAHYKEYLTDLKKRGIEPIVTLFHYTLPVWFSDMGGFEKRLNVKYFTRFAEKILQELGDSVKYVITVNEPEIYTGASYLYGEWPPAEKNYLKTLWVNQNLAYAHRQASKVIHKLSNRYKVAFAKHSSYFYPGDDSWLSKVSTVVLRYIAEDFITNKYIKGSDFIGVNYYHSNRVLGYRIHNPDEKLSDLHWDMQPANIQFVLERLYKKYKLPLIITENGLADRQDVNRKWWITETLLAMKRALNNGVDLRGYLHWSLIDNFEWAFGKWPRFGLVEIDYKTGTRTMRKSAIWFGNVIKHFGEKIDS